MMWLRAHNAPWAGDRRDLPAAHRAAEPPLLRPGSRASSTPCSTATRPRRSRRWSPARCGKPVRRLPRPTPPAY